MKKCESKKRSQENEQQQNPWSNVAQLEEVTKKDINVLLCLAYAQIHLFGW